MDGNWMYNMDDSGETPLGRAEQSGHWLLLDVLLNQEKADSRGSVAQLPPLHRAACLGLEEAVRALLKDGADRDGRDKHGETPLHKAVRQGHKEVAGVLLKSGADANAEDRIGLTPLHWTALNGRGDIAEVLLEHAADPHQAAVCADGLTAEDLANVMGYAELAESLKHGGAFAYA